MKQKVLIDVSVSIEPPGDIGRWSSTVERRAQAIEQWCSEFEDFVRDHRSQDPVSLTVERKYEMQCSHCHNEWEEEDGTGEPLCCRKAQEEWAASKVPQAA